MHGCLWKSAEKRNISEQGSCTLWTYIDWNYRWWSRKGERKKWLVSFSELILMTNALCFRMKIVDKHWQRSHSNNLLDVFFLSRNFVLFSSSSSLANSWLKDIFIRNLSMIHVDVAHRHSFSCCHHFCSLLDRLYQCLSSTRKIDQKSLDYHLNL